MYDMTRENLYLLASKIEEIETNSGIEADIGGYNQEAVSQCLLKLLDELQKLRRNSCFDDDDDDETIRLVFMEERW